MYQRLGRWSYQNRVAVVLGWVFALALLIGVAVGIGPSYDGAFEIPASESADGFALLEEEFPGAGGSFGGTIVFKADQGVDDPEVQGAMEELFTLVDSIEVDEGLDANGADLDDVTVRSPY
ncbi:MAG: hypothetical protein ACRBI6_01015, partial [Acidimicrobiales bacterium]